MVDDFCQAYATGKLSPTNAWQAARYNLPGLIAQESAMAGGVTMDIPDIPARFPRGSRSCLPTENLMRRTTDNGTASAFYAQQ